MKRLITVVTGSRAEFGLLKSLLTLIGNSHELELELLVSGSHLSEKHGSTIREIREMGFLNFHTIDLEIHLESEAEVGLAIGEVIKKFSLQFSTRKPSLVLVLGDRYEIFGVAIAAAAQGIPLGHIHGGEVTEGSRDDLYRHAITKLASVHFVANSEFRNRVVRLGESPDAVHIVGGLGLDAISKTRKIRKTEIEYSLGIILSNNLALVTFHPDTVNPQDTDLQTRVLINAMAYFPDIQFIITGSNADYKGENVNNLLQQASLMYSNFFFIPSLGQEKYLSLLSMAKFVLGNSSSGLLEAPSLKVATINVGSRQDGRPRADSVIDVECEESAIKAGIERSQSNEFQSLLATVNSPYGKPGASQKILKALQELEYEKLLPKRFFDGIHGAQ
jgi:GDP/UDP-N,N'-diacetylbacillosamine 2-epimerase (hydrolysing)